MVKIKRLRTADCIVAGFRYAQKGGSIGSLLLGLVNDDGEIDHVGLRRALPPPSVRPREVVMPPRRARIYRTRAGRTEPLEREPIGGLGAARSDARLRGPIRSFLRRPLPTRDQVSALAARQITPAVYVRAGSPGAATREVEYRGVASSLALACCLLSLAL